jgi:hypothetical protein
MFALVFLAALTGFVPPSKGSPDYSSFAAVTSRKVVPGDPGPPPAFDPAEYVPYRQPGKDVLTGAPFVMTADGQTHACLQGDYVWLYPSTAYTRWMLSKAAYHGFTTNQWPDPAEYVRAPDYLRFLSKQTIVREGDCQNGSFTIANLPPGKYVLFANIRIPGSGSSIRTTTENAVGPNGEPATAFHNEVNGTSFFEDGWILGSRVFNLDKPEGTLTTNPSDWFVFAHISAGH